MKLKKIFPILGLFILVSCIPKSKKGINKFQEETRFSKSEVVENIGLLREVGFFEEYSELANSELYDIIKEDRRKRFSKYVNLAKYPYLEPDMDLSIEELVKENYNRVFYTDLEADVIKGNKVYVRVIESISQLSNGKFTPREIQENWETESGPIEVSFKSDDSLIVFEPEYNDDWLDPSIFYVCRKEIEKRDVRIVECLFGDGVTVMRLTEEEQSIIENELNWKFSSINKSKPITKSK